MNNEMPNINSAMQFKGYKVEKLVYKEHTEVSEQTYNVCPRFLKQINQVSKKIFDVTLGCKIQPTKENPFPFETEVIITGTFEINKMCEETKSMIENNSIAILFPYLRSTLTMLTCCANINSLILPTINIVEMLKESDKQETKV